MLERVEDEEKEGEINVIEINEEIVGFQIEDRGIVRGDPRGEQGFFGLDLADFLLELVAEHRHVLDNLMHDLILNEDIRAGFYQLGFRVDAETVHETH